MALFRFVAVLVVLAGVASILLQRLPPQNSPFAPLDLEQPLGLATGWKLRGLRSSPTACHETLARSSLQFTPIADRHDGEFCGFSTVVAINRAALRWSPSVTITCPMAAALYVWEREVVAPMARQYLGSTVKQIEHFGTYACRRVNAATSATARVSQHATANAIDIAGFLLADGRRVTVAGDWSADANRGAFLRAIRAGACRLFPTVLSPDYNAAHADHFHFDMGPYAVCR